MTRSADSVTSPTLLGRLRQNPADQAAWSEFVAAYGGKIKGWCRKWGLQDSDAEDVTQNVLLDLARQMKEFEYQRSGRFRSWLKTVAYRAWCDHQGRRQQPGSGDSAVLQLLHSVAAREDFLKQMEEEGMRELLDIAAQRVRQRVQPHTWEAFRLTALEGLAGAETAARLGIKAGTVFVARAKVQKMLQEEVQRLDETGL